MEEEKEIEKNRSIRLQIWAGFFIVMGFLTVIFMPLEKAQALFDLFKEIIASLILG
jgi:uncharacterized membrane protein